VNVEQQAALRLRQRPGPAAEWCNPLPDRQVDPFDEGGLDRLSESLLFQRLEELPALAAFHPGEGERLTIAPLLASLFDQLTISQQAAYYSDATHPFTEMRGDGKEVGPQAIAGDGLNAALCQPQPEVMYKVIGIHIGPRAQVNLWGLKNRSGTEFRCQAAH